MRTIGHVELSAALLVAGFVGAVAGSAITFYWRFNEKRQADLPVVEPQIPPGANAVLSVLASSAVLVDELDSVVKASAPAHALGLIQSGHLVPPELLELVHQVRRDGQVRECDFTLVAGRSTAPAHLFARVAPLSSKLVVVLVSDRTREHRVEEIRRDFVANVSHELKTPIGAMSLLAEAVEEAKDDPDAVAGFAARMQTEGQRLTRLVQQIIDLSRLQGDAFIDEPAIITVADLIHTACDNSLTDAESQDIEIAVATHEGLQVLGDPDQLLAAVSNLVENAVTYSSPGSRVAVLGTQVDGMAHIKVTDHGIGISDTEIDRIFERFYRVDPARHRSTGGTGLGLSIVKHVAASHGGRVVVWSEPGEGSSFTMILPMHHKESDGDWLRPHTAKELS